MPWGSAALFGLRQISLAQLNSDGTTYAAGFLLPAPQMLECVETVVKKDLPGADAVADQYSRPTKLIVKMKWGKLNLSQQAAFTGGLFTSTGSTPNRIDILDRKIADQKPEFKLEGRVAYIGSDFTAGDYYFLGYRGKFMETPKWSNAQEQYADMEATIEFIPRIDDLWYQMQVRENASLLTGNTDLTAPTIVSSTPIQGATAVALATTIVITYSKAVLLDASNYSLIKQGATATDVAIAASINAAGTVVTLTPGSNLTAANTYSYKIANVKDTTASRNVLAASSIITFAT